MRQSAYRHTPSTAQPSCTFSYYGRWGATATATPQEPSARFPHQAVETTVRLLWLSMLKMPPRAAATVACHLLTWFSIIAEAVFSPTSWDKSSGTPQI
ncbi:solute carrier family 45 member 4 [Lates japonicus]|uniref:Solute carrier family 45 member 4 n=1 Tax=Lates japonicus TaxID=270547 RepID=A0AAD3R7Z8_LATJO|nr:solute carrier family 45 member 4 [Lates japonicus]